MSVQKQRAHKVSLISITLKHSPVGRPYRQRLVLKGLGLRRLHQTVQRPQTPQVLGLIDKVKHLIEITQL